MPRAPDTDSAKPPSAHDNNHRWSPINLIGHPDELARSPTGDHHTARLITTLLILIFGLQWVVTTAAIGVATRASDVSDWLACAGFGVLLPIGVMLVDALIIRRLVDGKVGLLALLIRFLLPVTYALVVAPILWTLLWAVDIHRVHGATHLSTQQTLLVDAGNLHDAGNQTLAANAEIIAGQLARIEEQHPAPADDGRLAKLKEAADGLRVTLAAAEREVARLKALAQCEAAGVATCPQGSTTGAAGEGKAYVDVLVLLNNAVAARQLEQDQLDAAMALVAGEQARIETLAQARRLAMGGLAIQQQHLQDELSKIQAQLLDRTVNRTALVQAAAEADPAWQAPADPGLLADLQALDKIASSGLTAWLVVYGGKLALVAFELSGLLAAHGLAHSQYGALRRQNLALASAKEAEIVQRAERTSTDQRSQTDDVRFHARYTAEAAKTNLDDIRRTRRRGWFRTGFARHRRASDTTQTTN